MEHERFKWLWSSWGVFIKGVRSWRLYLVFSFGALLLCAFIFLLVRHYFLVIPSRDLAAARIAPSWKHELTQKEAYDLQNSIRQTFVQALGGAIQALGGVALLLGLYFTAKTLRISADTLRTNQETLQTNQKALEVTQEGQITERFTKAIEHLGDKEHLMIRLGGIYALERIARDSARDHWPIMEVLTAYIRDNAPWPPKEAPPLSNDPNLEVQSPETHTDVSSTTESTTFLLKLTDIQAILTVIGRRTRSPDREGENRLDLHSTDLRFADLTEAQLEGAFLWKANLERAYLMWAQLKGAHLREAQMERADLREAQLEGAFLWEANLERANLGEANLERANLFRANLLIADLEGAQLEGADLEEANLKGANLLMANLFRANLEGANLEGANLFRANLKGAQLEGANLEGTILEGANLTEAVNLTVAQLHTVHTLYEADLDLALKEELQRIAPHLFLLKRPSYTRDITAL